MTNALRGAVVGFGRMGMTHYSILNSHPDVEFVAICDPSSFLRNKVEKHLQVAAYANHEEMIREADLDFVLIATPTGLHRDGATDAMGRGLHVFMEKPLATTPNDGQIILDSVSKHRVVNQVGYVLRFNDIFLAVKELLASQQLGDVISFSADVRGPTILHDVKEGWRATKSSGGGCLRDFASHAIDLVCYLFGPPDDVAGSVLQKIHSTSVEDAVYSTLKYADGAVGTLRANWSDHSYRKPTYNFDILCRRGRITADLHEFKVFFSQTPETDKYEKGWNTVYVTDIAEPVRVYLRGYEFTRQLDYFISQIQSGRHDSIASFEDGLATDRVISMIAEDAGETQ